MAIPGASGNPTLSAAFICAPKQAVKLVSQVLETCNGNISQTAKKLKVGRNTLKRWIAKHQELRNIVISYRESI